MKKKKILIVLVLSVLLLFLIFFAVAAYLFSPKGNEFLKNYAEKELNQKTDIPVEIKTLEINSGKIVLEIYFKDSSKIVFNGKYSLTGLWAKGVYDADIKDLSVLKEFTGRKLHGSLKIKGNLKWEKGELKFEGLSDIFGGKSSFSGSLNAPVIKDFSLDIQKLNVKKMFETLGFPFYTTGDINARADIASFNLHSKKIEGRLDISSKNIRTVDSELKRTLQLDYVEPVKAEIYIISNFQDTFAVITANVTSNIASLKTSQTAFDLSTKTLESEYEIYLPDLKKLKFIAERNMIGDLRVKGDIKKEGEMIYFSASTGSLGGSIAIDYNKNKLTAEMRDVSAAKVSSMFAMDDMFGKGEFSLDADAVLYGENREEVLKNLYGKFHLKGRNIVLNLIDIDGVIEGLSRTKQINLFDIGAIALAGPLGFALTKAEDVSRTAYSSYARGSSVIKEINAQWIINRGIAETEDVAFSTKKNRLASRGRIDLKSQRFLNFNIALIDEQGCSTFMQRVEGRLTNPKVSASKTFAETARNIFDSIVSKVPVREDKQQNKCEFLYKGVVQHPVN